MYPPILRQAVFSRSISQVSPPKPQNRGRTGITVAKKLLQKNDDDLKDAIASVARDFYHGEDAKALQIDTVANLARGRDTFLLAGTGFGKSRIAEIYHTLLPKREKGVVLVLNPLDALGDNQVQEKAGMFTAINLTKLTFNSKVAEKIKRGDYNFVYLSPEIFMNNKMWDSVYFSSEFQNRLSLVVVDEAHMIYVWGLVASTPGKSRSISIITRHEDGGIFRPCYGKIGLHLQCRNNAPLLLLSATCRPVAIDSILKSLKLSEKTVDFFRGELTRPEIRIIRIKMSYSLSSCHDLLNIFPQQEELPDKDVVPTLIYSGTRARTVTVLEVLGRARGTPSIATDPTNSFARRFHSVTGDRDKEDVVNDFSDGKFPIISATMALGLGQNWKRVRSVIHMGRGDPANVCQMIGRCGRNGNNGLAILFVEASRKGGKNKLSDFNQSNVQSDNDRMDALALTPVCLRIAFAIDNALGYIPLSSDDVNYQREVQREVSLNFSKCKCSNCDEKAADILINNMKHINNDNFDRVLKDDYIFPLDEPENIRKRKSQSRQNTSASKSQKFANDSFASLKEHLVEIVHNLYNNNGGEYAQFDAHELFDISRAELIINNLDQMDSQEELETIIGGETIAGQVKVLWDYVLEFKRGSIYEEHIKREKQLQLQEEERKKQTKRDNAARYRANARARKATTGIVGNHIS